MSAVAGPKKLSFPQNERVSAVRPEDTRAKAPGKVNCLKCGTDRIHISGAGNHAMPFLMRLFFVCYRCHTCGNQARHTRVGHVLRWFFGSAKKASLNVLRGDQTVDSQSSEFKPIRRDRQPTFRNKIMEKTSIRAIVSDEFDPDIIVKEIRSKYTMEERRLLSSRFNEIAALITPPISLTESQPEQ